MPTRIILIIISVLVALTMLFGNKKVQVFPILKRQLDVYKNAKTNKLYFWDIICFILFPIVLAVIMVVGLKISINDTLAEILTTIFAIVFTVLFGFAAILVGKIDSDNIIEKQVVGETFISIMTSTILSLLSSILSIVIVMSASISVDKWISTCLFALSFMIIMLLLMISKRTFIIYTNNSSDNN